MKPLSILTGIIRLAIIALLFSLLLGFNPILVFAGLAVLSCIIPLPNNVAMGVVLEAWAAYIIKRFYKDNMFLSKAYDDSPYVLQGRIVHIPQPGAKPTVVKNRAVFPATAVRRTDTDVVYALDEYTTDPTHIPNIDKIHLSYNKQDSVLGEHMAVLDETVADDILVKWAANATIVKTTGTAVGPVTGQTGNRLGFTHKDLQKLMIKMNVDNVPKKGRSILIDDNMYEFFYDGLSENSQRDFSKYVNAEDGIIGRLHGFDCYTRSSVLGTTAADGIKALGAAIGATDNLGSLAWHRDSVAVALGEKKVFQDVANPLYYGDVHSALVMAGGRVRRADALGVYLLAQGTP